jgi:hypothetical protein
MEIASMSDTPQKFLTRQGLIPYIRERFGVSVTKSTIDKSRMNYDTPKPDRFYGPKELFLEETADRYARDFLIREKPSRLIDAE